MKANERIYIHDWLALKPYQQQTITDSYYLKLSNEVKQTILSEKTAFVFYMYINKEDIDLLSCFLCAWFEDLISQTNIYGSFVSVHKRLYKKQLPFYNLDEYYEDEINPQDISFLIWYFLNTVQTEKFIAPFNDFIDKTAEKIFAIFDNAWDHAPENKLLKSIYTSNENETDFYTARNLIDTILFKTYLFYPDTLFRLSEQEAEIIEGGGDNKNLLAILNENRDSSLHESHTRLLSLKGKEWAAEIIGTEHPRNPDFLNASERIRGYFFYKGQDEFNISLEHIASGKKFKLCKKSFDNSSKLKVADTIVFMGIVKWRDEWWFSGVYFQTEFNANLVLDEKNSLESRRAVDFLDHKSKETEETIAANTLGSTVHDVLAELYRPFISRIITAEDVRAMLPQVDALTEKYFKKWYIDGDVSFGINLLSVKMAKVFIINLLKTEALHIEKMAKDNSLLT